MSYEHIRNGAECSFCGEQFEFSFLKQKICLDCESRENIDEPVSKEEEDIV